MTQKKDKNLFSDFPPVTVQQWEELIHQDLKGADYDKKLVWQSIEGIPVRPYYAEEHIKDIEYLDSLPGEFPFIRGKKTRSNDWLVRQDIIVSDIGKANAEALDALMKGAGSICFILDGETNYSSGDISRLLNDICISSAEINFCCGIYSLQILRALDSENAKRGGALSSLRGSIGYDPIGELLTTGAWPAGEERSFDLASEMIRFRRKLPRLTVINVDASVFHNSGGSAVQELAFAMASAGEYLQRLSGKGVSAGETAEKIRFTFAVGSNYFMEIAKFRAARYLWSLMLEAWEVKPETAGKLSIHAVTSGWNKTIYDPFVNMLRTTTESMAAVLGGADSVTAEPFDNCFRKPPSAFSARIARNTQLVLKEEAYMDKVADPAAGSYYIESLTRSLIGEAWKLFLQIDEMGGITEAFKKGVIQDMIEETVRVRNSHLAVRRDTLLGTNQYPDPSGKIPDIDLTVAFPEQATAEAQAGRPLKRYRGAEAFEQIRLKTENHPGGPPRVFLLTYGNVGMSKARAGFSAGFFSCAGFGIIDNPVSGSLLEGVEAALGSKAEIIVLCSSDEEYPMVIPSAARELSSKAILVVAGNPRESIDLLKEAGVKYFIHLRSDIPETLRQFQKEVEIQ